MIDGIADANPSQSQEHQGTIGPVRKLEEKAKWSTPAFSRLSSEKTDGKYPSTFECCGYGAS